MDVDTLLTNEFQKVLLNSSTSISTKINNKADINNQKTNNSDTFLNSLDNNNSALDDNFNLDTQDFDKWIPFLRDYAEKDALDTIIDELDNSVDDNFQDLEFHLLQDSQINDKLETSMKAISGIQSTIQQDIVNEVNLFQSELNQSTNELILKKHLFVNNKKVSLKISEAMILINKIVRLLELSSKCQNLIQERKFFKALQNLDNLERLYLQEFKDYNFEFLKEIYNSVPKLKAITKDECINLIKNSFNSNLGKNLVDIGSQIFFIYENQLLKNWEVKKKNTKIYSNFNFNSPVEISTRDQETLEKINFDNFFNLDEFYDTIMIFQKLNELPYLIADFDNEYEFRKNKIIHPLIWKNTSNSVTDDISDDTFTRQLSLDFIKEYLIKILGFLCYDINLHKQTEYLLVNNNYNTTNEFWDALMFRLCPYLKYYLKNNLTLDNELVDFKNFLAMFICILENFKLNIEPLYEIMISIFEKFCHLAIEDDDKKFMSLLNDDDFMPLVVNDSSLLQKIIKICWLTEDKQLTETVAENDGSSSFSAVLPFSPLYPMSCTLVQKTHTKLLGFLKEFYRHDLTTLNNILIKTMETVFNSVIDKKIRAKLDSNSREEISQILINLDYFIIAAKEFSSFMTRESILQNPDFEIRLSSIDHFTESRKIAETRLIKLIDSKINDILEMVNFEWTTTEVRHDPDISIIDLGQFLEMMFASTLINLPYSVQSLLIFREFDSLTRTLLDILLHETPNKITRESVGNFQIDIQYLQSIIPRIFETIKGNSRDNKTPLTPSTPTFSGSNNTTAPLTENNAKTLEETFAELNQCLDLLKSGNIQEYNDPQLRSKKYSRVKPEEAKILATKITPLVQQNTSGSTSDISSSDEDYNTDNSSNGNRIANFFSRR